MGGKSKRPFLLFIPESLRSNAGREFVTAKLASISAQAARTAKIERERPEKEVIPVENDPIVERYYEDKKQQLMAAHIACLEGLVAAAVNAHSVAITTARHGAPSANIRHPDTHIMITSLVRELYETAFDRGCAYTAVTRSDDGK